MPRDNYQSVRVANFGGPLRNALAARNIRYLYAEDGSAPVPTAKLRTREGHEPIWATTFPVRSMYNFAVTNPDTDVAVNLVLFLDEDSTGLKSLKAHNVVTNADSTSLQSSSNAVKAVVAEASTRAYVAFPGINGNGTVQGIVVDSALNADRLFAPPPSSVTITMTLTEPSSGSVTAGLRKVAMVINTRTGYTTQPGLVNAGGAFVPSSITSSGGKIISVAVSGLWPQYAQSVAILATTSTNRNKYFFVPNTTFAVNGGGSSSFTATIDISDDDLLLEPSADNFFNLLSQSPVDGSGPFNPSFTLAYRNRMVYGAGDRIYISDPFDYQSITADQHVQFLPGENFIYAAFPHRDGNLYLLSSKGTFTLSDNGDVPATWSGPQVVDMQVGTNAGAFGVTRDPSSDNVWVADHPGLRLFTQGSFGDRPISFWQPDWQRINWNAAMTLEIMDDVQNQCVRILVPLDQNSAPSHEMVFDYRRGKSPELIAYSLNTIPGRYCFALVRSDVTKTPEIWLGPAAAVDNVWRRDKQLWQDNGVDIADQVYETKRLIDVDQLTGVLMFHGAHYSARGNAALTLKGYAQDHQRETEPKVDSLDGSFAWQRILRQWKMTAENESLQFSTQAGWFELAEVEAYYSEWLGQR